MYLPPGGIEVDFIFLVPGYTEPNGDEIDFIFRTGFYENCEDDFNFDDFSSIAIARGDSIEDSLDITINSADIVSWFSISLSDLFINQGVEAKQALVNFLSDFFNMVEDIGVFIPSGVLQLILNPYSMVEVDMGDAIELSELETFIVPAIQEISQESLGITELETDNGVIITEV